MTTDPRTIARAIVAELSQPDNADLYRALQRATTPTAQNTLVMSALTNVLSKLPLTKRQRRLLSSILTQHTGLPADHDDSLHVLFEVRQLIANADDLDGLETFTIAIPDTQEEVNRLLAALHTHLKTPLWKLTIDPAAYVASGLQLFELAQSHSIPSEIATVALEGFGEYVAANGQPRPHTARTVIVFIGVLNHIFGDTRP